MFFNTEDTRQALKIGFVVETDTGKRYVIDRFLGSGGYSLMYLAHEENAHRYIALKELFPRDPVNGVANRMPNGKIVIYDPITQEGVEDTDRLEAEFSDCFRREVAMTEKAGMQFDRSGKRTMQNNADVLHVEGPMHDRYGNIYLAVDTYNGESLRDLIEGGFIHDENGKIRANERLPEIIDILVKTTVHLSHLHGDCKLYHLDLSPDNIYLVRTAGGTALEPHIIDYGSAYDIAPRVKSSDPLPHRYTCNAHSAPEVLALAALQSPDCGYSVDRSSDTYSLVSILFYAATGLVFTQELRTLDRKWKEQLRSAYSSGLNNIGAAEDFAGSLIEVITRGLSAGQSDRYTTAKQLRDTLLLLKRRYHAFGNLLPLVKPDELVSYMVLEKHPLYRYRNVDGDIHVLCLGCGVFVKRMILSMISCGQMTDAALFIHIVSNEPQELFSKGLLSQAKGLAQYSNLSVLSGDTDTQPIAQYVTFEYERVSDLLAPHAAQELVKKYDDARYVVISLGSNNANINAANLMAAAFAAHDQGSPKNTIINYYVSEDAADNRRADIVAADLPEQIVSDAFGDGLSSYGKVLRKLGQRTLRVAHLYDKLYEPRISLDESAKRLLEKEYLQRSSCATALHIRYKLESLGIRTENGNKARIAASYRKALSGKAFGELIELEHRRWMMYMIADGYTCPTEDDLWEFGFRSYEGRFNASWKYEPQKLHPCIVPCDCGGMRLTHDLWQEIFTQCDCLEAIEEKIDSADLDALDKQSLRLHLLAMERCRAILEDGDIDRCFRKISRELSRTKSRRNDIRLQNAFGKIETSLSALHKRISASVKNYNYPDVKNAISNLKSDFSELGLGLSGELDRLLNLLSVFAEYAAEKDYKLSDATFIRNLMWAYCAEENLTLIKLNSRTLAENIISPLVLAPRELIYYGTEEQPQWCSFLQSQGNRGLIRFCSQSGSSVAEIVASLEPLVRQSAKKCVIDITGADELSVLAAQRVAAQSSKTALIRSLPDGTIENISGFPLASIYTLNARITPSDIYALHGASELPGTDEYMENFRNLAPQLWDFYCEYRDDWEQLCAFFAHDFANSDDLYIAGYCIDETTCWKSYQFQIDKLKWDALELSAVMNKLEASGFIRKLTYTELSPALSSVEFEFPGKYPDNQFDPIYKRISGFFRFRVEPSYLPFRCNVSVKDDNTYYVSVRSGCVVNIHSKDGSFTDKSNPSKVYHYKSIEAPLHRLEELGLIRIKTLNFAEDGSANIHFIYADPALPRCLSKAGNILELYVWSEALRTRQFDDCRANFFFRWKEAGVKNELDVIMTKGLRSLVVSCKTAKYNKEHLYEIKYLTDRFSLNSVPVIVYSSTKSFEDGRISDDLYHVKMRAAAMGIRLIDLNEPGPSLGERLVEIIRSPQSI